MSAVLRIALQKSGRLSEDSLALLTECGLDLTTHRGSSRLKSRAENFPAEILFLRDDDIPGYVADGVADAGIVGENTIVESAKGVTVVEKLGFSKCRLSIAVPRDVPYESPHDLASKRIATSHPVLLKEALTRWGVEASIHEISGSVEIAPSIGLADAVCDLVGTGSTLFSNGLKEVEVVFESQAALISSPTLESKKSEILQKLLFRMRSVRRAKHNKYILLNAPNEALPEIVKTLPGMKSPTIVPLAESGWSSVHSVVNENEFWDIIENLREVGAQGILICPIEKMIL